MKMVDLRMKQFADDFKKSASFAKTGYRLLLRSIAEMGTLQRTHTPFDLCEEILAKYNEYCPFAECESILVLFNVEFVEVLVKKYGVDPSRITFICDSNCKEAVARKWYNVSSIHRVVYGKAIGIEIMPKIKRRFDAVVMNSPYQAPTQESKGGGSKSHGNTLWDKFVTLSISLCKKGGYMAHVHPSRWRKPGSDTYSILSKMRMLYLHMHSKKDGIKIFKASTPFDWYIVQNAQESGTTKVVDTTSSKVNINLGGLSFLPNCDFDKVLSLIAKEGEEKCEVLYSRSEYGTDKEWMSEEKTGKFRYPCVHATSKGGIRYWYSSKKGIFFNSPKLIFGESDTIQNAIVDFDGEYGITNGAIGIIISSSEEGIQIKKAIESKEFNNLIQNALRWSQFRIDWRVFAAFRKDFWRDFI